MGVYNLAMSSGVFLGAVMSGLISDFLGLGWLFVLVGLTVLGLTLGASLLIVSSERPEEEEFSVRQG